MYGLRWMQLWIVFVLSLTLLSFSPVCLSVSVRLCVWIMLVVVFGGSLPLDSFSVMLVD
jgi:hypothetical protein